MDLPATQIMLAQQVVLAAVEQLVELVVGRVGLAILQQLPHLRAITGGLGLPMA